MVWMRGALAAGALGLAVLAGSATAGPASRIDFGRQQASGETRRMAQWVLQARDHAGLPFAIVDKKDARIYVFDAAGRLQGASPALLGQAFGDDIAPDVGEHAQTGQVPFDERTTPAGRFESEPGRNTSGEHVVWVDYDSAFAIHRLRTGAALRDREVRMASADATQHRVSLGCVVVPPQFYDNVVRPLLGVGRAVVYVLPETRAIEQIFDSL